MKRLSVKVFAVASHILMFLAPVSFLVLSFVVKSDHVHTYDLFNMVIPEPPVWTSYIPYLGIVIGYAFSFFSLHGLVQIAILIGLVWFGQIVHSVAERLEQSELKVTYKIDLQNKTIAALQEEQELQDLDR